MATRAKCAWVMMAMLLLAACGDAGRTDDAPPSRADAESREDREPESEGRTLYLHACVMCHGEHGAGTQLAPALNDSTRTVAAVADAVTRGVPEVSPPHTPMPPRGDGTFTEAQVRAVAEYVHALHR